MSVLPIEIGAENPILRKKTTKVKSVTKDIKKLIDDMLRTMTRADGAGIAAPQVGRNERLCIALIGGKAEVLVNPEITFFSKDTLVAEEGCLSLPGIWIDVPRSKDIIVSFTNARGQNEERKLSEWDARVVQHEVDHLEGKLIVDYRT